MKKTLFIAFAVVGLSQFSFAQEAARMTPATPDLNDKATKEKMAKMNAVANPDPAKPAVKVTATDPNVANYKKAGVDDKKIAEIVSYTNEIDKKKAAINADSQLTAEQKKNSLASIEAERSAVLSRTMGETSYKKYSLLSASTAKQTRAKGTPRPAAAKSKN